MASNPWYQWWHKDWRANRKVQRMSAEGRGVWREMIDVMMENETYQIAGTVEDLARDCGLFPDETERGIREIIRRDVAEVTETPSGQNGDSPAFFTIVSRRLRKDEKKREYERERKKKYRDEQQKDDVSQSCPEEVPLYGSGSGSGNGSVSDNSEEDERFSERDWQYAAATNFLDSLAKADCLTASTSAIEKRSEILQKWADVFDKLHRIDGHDQATILSVCHWLFQPGNWWIENRTIMTATKLRKTNSDSEKYFDILLIQSKRKNHAKNDAKQNPISSAARIRDAILADDY